MTRTHRTVNGGATCRREQTRQEPGAQSGQGPNGFIFTADTNNDIMQNRLIWPVNSDLLEKRCLRAL